ncbi:LrgB family protein [Clostridium sp. MCC353]|uniref:LrgB family protein n=1 Tax=Clostridium sp. MCC353 TaxID=2592646 RepID=UPI001C02C5A7|nr:LrgB family protein [Clostridium sp. MCC353]MBT9779147.1 LrgB family protein [Clostridium sp. MCC353]
MSDMLSASLFFGLVISTVTYLFGIWVKNKTKLALFNPLLISVALVILFLVVFKIDYEEYNRGASYISYFLTPATVCLAIPLYKQLRLLKKHLLAVIGGIASGVAASAFSIFALSLVFKLEHVHYVTLLPKSITTAIGMGVSEEAGGIVTLTVVSIIITGILGNIIAETLFKIAKITHPIAKGLALGTSAHAIGTAKALEIGEIEGAMSSLAIAVAGLMTVLVVPVVSGLI